MSVSRTWKSLVILILASAALAPAQAPHDEPSLAVIINKVTPAKYGFEVAATVTNVGVVPATFAVTGVTESTLHSLFVQQWDSKLGWQEVGQCHDALPAATMTLKPGSSFTDTAPIGDLAHGFVVTPCPRHVQHLHGSIRAAVCAFKSELEFQNRVLTNTACKEYYSPTFDLPESAVGLGSK